MKAKVAERGQMTIPQKIRIKLGIRPGTILDCQVRGHTLVIFKTEGTDPIKEAYGCLGKLHTDAVLNKLRGDS